MKKQKKEDTKKNNSPISQLTSPATSPSDVQIEEESVNSIKLLNSSGDVANFDENSFSALSLNDIQIEEDADEIDLLAPLSTRIVNNSILIEKAAQRSEKENSSNYEEINIYDSPSMRTSLTSLVDNDDDSDILIEAAEKSEKKHSSNYEEINIYDPSIRTSSTSSSIIDDDDIQIEKNASCLTPERKAFAKGVIRALWRLAGPLIEGGIAYFATEGLVGAISSGFPAEYQSVMQNFAKYGTVPLGLLGATNKILEQQDVRRFIVPQHLVKGLFSGISLSTFLSQFAFFLTTDIIRARDGLPPDEQVDISDWAAAVIISTCCATGFLEGCRTYFMAEKKEIKRIEEEMIAEGYGRVSLLSNDDGNSLPPLSRDSLLLTQNENILFKILINSRRSLRWLTTNKISRPLLSALDGGSSIHSFLYVAEGMANVQTKNWALWLRYGGTGVAALIAGGILGIPLDEHWYTKLADDGLDIIKAFSYGMTAFYTFDTPSDKNFWGKPISKEEEFFWTVFLPLYILLLQTTFFCYKRKRASNKARNQSEIAYPGYDEIKSTEEIEEGNRVMISDDSDRDNENDWVDSDEETNNNEKKSVGDGSEPALCIKSDGSRGLYFAYPQTKNGAKDKKTQNEDKENLTTKFSRLCLGKR